VVYVVDKEVQKALALIADFIVKKRYSTSWPVVAGLVGYDLADENPRLVRSQMFTDDDYPAHVLKFLTDIYRKNKDEARFVISHIVREGDAQEAIDPEYSPAFELLEIIPKTGVKAALSLSIIKTRYVDVDRFPDDFYKGLVEQINACYQHAVYPASQILIRKLLENCLIDILRKRYGLAKIDMFYNTSKGHFHDFSTLLENANTRIKDFAHVKDPFDENLLKKINSYREQGNSSAHNISLDNQAILSGLDNSRSELNFIVKSLFRTISLL
jgi:hypothetical protein